jgi:hypothetical protein
MHQDTDDICVLRVILLNDALLSVEGAGLPRSAVALLALEDQESVLGAF